MGKYLGVINYNCLINVCDRSLTKLKPGRNSIEYQFFKIVVVLSYSQIQLLAVRYDNPTINIIPFLVVAVMFCRTN